MEFTKCQKVAIKGLTDWWESGKKQYYVVGGFAGCIDDQSLITTDQGIKTLEEIILMQRSNLAFNDFETFMPDLNVLSHDGTWNPITHIYATPDNTEGFEIKTNLGLSLKGSYIHPVMIYSSDVQDYKWKRLEDVKLGDTILIKDQLDHGFSPDKVTSITPCKQKFYDITVANTESFIANGIVSHNTGKTTIVKHLINEIASKSRGSKFRGDMSFLNEFMDTGNGTFSVVYTTFTGKAAQVLRQNGLPGKTIHSTIYRPVENKDKSVNFVLRDRTELADIDLIVVDEGSMVSRDIFRDLLSFDIPVIVLGDIGQLPNVENDGFNIMEESDVFMTTITRQAEESPIIQLATMARKGEFIPNGIYGEGVGKFPASQCSVAALTKADQVIVGTNKTRIKLNDLIRKHLGFDSLYPLKGDKLVCLKNNYDISLINGLVGYADEDVRDPHSGEVSIGLQFSSPEFGFPSTLIDVSLRDIDPAMIQPVLEMDKYFDKELQRFDYGYALTCHKCQGSQYDYPIVFDEPFGDEDFRKKWRYTAYTRAVSKLIILEGTPEALKK